MKRKIVIGVVTAAVLAGGGAATAAALSDGDHHDGRDGRGAGRSAAASDEATARIAVGDAVAAAVKAVPGTVTEAELDDEDGGPVWELDVYGSDRAWHEVTVDAESGKVLGRQIDRDDDDRDRRAPRSVSVSLRDAVAAALKSAPGAVTSVELDDEHGDGAPHWEVEVRTGGGEDRELDVDAKSGAVRG
ncbi:PepSY domain-containing protein [Streptomyces sp. NBC_00525]|uniref:PepSY domain-containing protein n=1 Tax=Streptomyces sp. NBC_00525 TaxID=2903660 RepID=UPI002E81BFC9|nr:PepSY domain-containing protein [Streptomyces sp. NBC_00525]WUC96035.1 PepSY domain-containing protein [Streptomyces sp. NBC_00525]